MACAWNYASGVTECRACEGRGAVSNGRGMGGNDPDSWDIDCDACEGIGHHACEVCGFDLEVDGYDCAVCETAAFLPDDVTAAQFADCLGLALKASRKPVGQAA